MPVKRLWDILFCRVENNNFNCGFSTEVKCYIYAAEVKEEIVKIPERSFLILGTKIDMVVPKQQL